MATSNGEPGAVGGQLRARVSFAASDRVWARWIGRQLHSAGHAVDYDELSWQPGPRFLASLETSLATVDKIVAVVSPAYLERTSFGQAEREAATRLAHRRRAAFLAVLVAPTTVPALFDSLSCVSLVGLGDVEARRRLLASVAGDRPSGDQPAVAPETGTAGRAVEGWAEVPFPGQLDGLAIAVGAALPAYDVGARLGTGGFGTVFAARHRGLNRPVAVKVLAADRQAYRARFNSEARVLAGLDRHAHVVHVYDYVEHDGLCMIVMELLTGGTLASRVARLSQRDACALALAVADALSYVHDRGVLHRDVKPDNMLFHADGLLKVTDFGIAKILDGTGANASVVIGTPRYMAPEQIRGERLGPATDLYSLAAMFHELLGGAPMFGAGLSLPALYHRHLHVVPAPPAGAPPAVAGVVGRALAKNPADRHPSAHAFALDLVAAACLDYGRDWLADSAVTVQLREEFRSAGAGGMPSRGSSTASDDTSVIATSRLASLPVPPTPPTQRTLPTPPPSDPPVPEPLVALAPSSEPGGSGRGGDGRGAVGRGAVGRGVDGGGVDRPSWSASHSRRRLRVALIGYGTVAVVALAALAATVLWPDRPVLGGCPQVVVFTGDVGSPYHRYGAALATRIHDEYPGTSVFNQPTSGSAASLDNVRSPTGSRCALAVSQLNTAVDAYNGASQFGSRIEGLRTVGPLGYDLLHVLVRRAPGLARASDLCGKRVAVGPDRSGTLQISEVLFRVLGCAADEAVVPVRISLDDGVARLGEGTVDAVLWAGGSPTAAIRSALARDAQLTLLPTAEYLDDMDSDWNRRYGGLLGGAFVPGSVYSAQDAQSKDYPTVGQVATVGLPNGLTSNADADPDLVAFAVRTLFDHRPDFEAALWGEAGAGRRFPSASESVGENPVYCLVPLHPVAARYYDTLGVRADCDPVGS